MPYIKNEKIDVGRSFKGKVSQHAELEINSVDGALEALRALSVFMFTQRNYIKSEDYIGICGDIEVVKRKIKKHLSIFSEENG